MQKHNPLPTTPTKGDRFKYAFTCPPHGKVGAIFRRPLHYKSVAAYDACDSPITGVFPFTVITLLICRADVT
jgi:hypothetical protein